MFLAPKSAYWTGHLERLILAARRVEIFPRIINNFESSLIERFWKTKTRSTLPAKTRILKYRFGAIVFCRVIWDFWTVRWNDPSFSTSSWWKSYSEKLYTQLVKSFFILLKCLQTKPKLNKLRLICNERTLLKLLNFWMSLVYCKL